MKLRIGHRTITFRRAGRGEAADTLADGMYLPNEGAIWISDDNLPEVQAEKAIHEVIHGIWDAYGIAPTVNEETAATVLGKGFAQVLRDNPAFVAVLLAALDGAQIFPRKGAK